MVLVLGWGTEVLVNVYRFYLERVSIAVSLCEGAVMVVRPPPLSSY